MPYSHILWDWNGTLLDDVNWNIEKMNTILSARNMKTIQSLAEYHDVFCFPVIEYYRNVGFDFLEEPFDTLAREYISLYHGAGSDQLKLYENAGIVLKHSKAKNITQVILSASAQENLLQQLSLFDIAGCFSEILGLSDIYAKSKVDLGKQYIANTDIKKALLIGDTTHDYEVSRALEIDCLLIAQGHQSRETLCKCNVPVLSGLIEVLDYVV